MVGRNEKNINGRRAFLLYGKRADGVEQWLFHKVVELVVLRNDG